MIEARGASVFQTLRREAGRFVFAFKIQTALKGWVGRAPQGRGALHIIIILIFILNFIFDFGLLPRIPKYYFI
jgi:hypothetical protein